MTGELLSIENNKLTVTSLDGHRISVRNIELQESYSKTEVIVPGKTLSEVSKILPFLNKIPGAQYYEQKFYGHQGKLRSVYYFQYLKVHLSSIYYFHYPIRKKLSV